MITIYNIVNILLYANLGILTLDIIKEIKEIIVYALDNTSLVNNINY